MRILRCGECGIVGMKLRDVKGSKWYYKNLTDVVITEDLELYCCDNCPNIGFASGQAKLIDEAIVKSLAKLGIVCD